MTKISNKLMIALLITTGLTACNTTSSGITSDATSGAANLAELEKKGVTINSQGTLATVTESNIPGTTSTVTNKSADFKVKKNATGGYDITSAGKSYSGLGTKTFSQAHADVTLNGFTSFHSNIIFGVAKISDNVTDLAAAVYGIKPSKLPEKTATYVGKANPAFYLASDVTLDLDFEKSTLTGKLDNFKERTQSSSNSIQIRSIAGELNMSNGKIAADKITTDLSGKILDKTTTGKLDGAVYGINGEEVAGTIATTIDGKEQITGGFIAKK